MHTGLVISFEGISNAGKTTAVTRMKSLLSSKAFQVVVKEDLLAYRGDTIGAAIKRILDSAKPTYRLGYPFAETLLITAKRAFESQTRLEPAVSDGAIVLCDRDVDTVCAYQLPVLHDHRPHIPLDVLVAWMRETNRLSAIEPALTFFLSVGIEESIAREVRKLGREMSEDERKAWRDHNLPIMSAFPKVLDLPMEGRRLIRVDTDKIPVHKVLETVEEAVLSWLRERDFRV